MMIRAQTRIGITAAMPGVNDDVSEVFVVSTASGKDDRLCACRTCPDNARLKRPVHIGVEEFPPRAKLAAKLKVR
jgi:hypothetical protein